MFKEGSNPLFPILNKTPNLLNYYSAIKLNSKSDLKRPNKRLASNDLNNFQHKKFIENSSGIKILKEINKTYSSSRQKEENPNIKLNNTKPSKITPLDFSPNINDSATKIEKIEKNKNNNNSHKRALLSANKIYNKTYINFDMLDYKNNLNVISPHNLGKSQIFNNNNIYNLKKPNKNNIIEITNSNNNSYYKNIIINNNSSKNINPNSKLINQKKSNNNYYLKTDKYNIGAKTPKDSSVKLIFNNKNINSKKLEDTPIILKKKDSSLPLKNNNDGNNLKVSIDKNALNGEYKLHLKKLKNIKNDNNIINMNLNNYINIQKE